MSAAIATPQVGPTLAIPTPVPSEPGYFARLKRFTVAEYHELIRLGVLNEKSRVELLDGYLVNKISKNPPHVASLTRLRKLIDRMLSTGWVWRAQEPVTLAESEPEPDLAVVRGADDDYDTRHPAPADVGLVVEVADTTVADDRTDKGRIYARAGIPVYWIINLPDRQIEVYTDPQPAASPPAYATRRDYRPGDTVPVVLDGVAVGTVPVAEVLP